MVAFITSLQIMDITKAFYEGYKKFLDASLGRGQQYGPLVVAPDLLNSFGKKHVKAKSASKSENLHVTERH